MPISLHAHLWNLNTEEQKKWLRQAGAWDKTLTRKAQFVAAIEAFLRDNLAELVGRLSEAEKHLLAESAHQERLSGVREFEAKYGGPCPMPKAYYSWNEPVSLLIGLICRPQFSHEGEPQLAHELVAPLRTLLPKPVLPDVRTLAELPPFWSSERQVTTGDRIRPVHIHEGERIAPAELARVLRLIHGGKVRVADSSRRPSDAAARLMAEALVVPDFSLELPKEAISQWTQLAGPVRAHAWVVLVQQCAWARPQSGVLKLTASGQEILRAFSPEAFRAGVVQFLGNAAFDELHRVNHIRGQSGKARRWIRDPASRKAALQEAMGAFPVGEWLAFEEARRIIDASGKQWDVLEEDAGVFYFAEPRYGVIHDMRGLNSQFLRALFLESFATLGLLDVGYVYPHALWPDLSDSWGIDDLSFCGRYDGLLYVRLNPLGAYVLDYADTYEHRPQAVPKTLSLLPNFEIRVESDVLNAADRAGLELLAEPLGDNATWRLDPQRILSHVEAGGTLAELQAFLESNAVDGMPEGWHNYLNSIADRIRAFKRSREATLLEWENEELARHLATDAPTSASCFHAGGNRLVVPNDRLAAFRRELKKLGFAMPSR